MNLYNQFWSARKDDSLAVLEGFHTLKHAIRFKAELIQTVTPNKQKLLELTKQLAPDILESVEKIVKEINAETYKTLSSTPPRSGVISIAQKPTYILKKILSNGETSVLLDDPRDLENVGAVIRVSAAAGVNAVFTTGQLNPWNPAAIRGSAGLHFALPVLQVTSKQIIDSKIPLIGLDERGEALNNQTLKTIGPKILVFGSERSGISSEIRQNLSNLIRIPMQPNVSSLNLATSVAITLYCL